MRNVRKLRVHRAQYGRGRVRDLPRCVGAQEWAMQGGYAYGGIAATSEFPPDLEGIPSPCYLEWQPILLVRKWHSGLRPGGRSPSARTATRVVWAEA